MVAMNTWKMCGALVHTILPQCQQKVYARQPKTNAQNKIYFYKTKLNPNSFNL